MILRDRGYELIKAELFKHLGVSGDAYKDTYLKRRIQARMRKLGISNTMEYYQLLRKNRQELNNLILTVAINVTEFFRDPPVWRTFQKKIIPELIRYKREANSRSIKIWSAACSTGQEPYSIAISLYETLGDDLKGFKISILGTDIDREALQIAIKGVYPVEVVEKNIPKHVINKYFLKSDEFYRVLPKLRKLVKFQHFNLFSRAYPKGFDVIFLRNVLIYMEKEAQEKVFRQMYEALENHGYLILGKTETILGNASHLFKLYDLPSRIYKKNLEVGYYGQGIDS
ncbi:chemotaxis protein [Thermococcus litoralis DSM 5473]|uniref:protein-glutamate O-methyltransferase n=1 Tax=Thermococcus litoralis (strain ATCC 51850 / DSM 5473 / JCM 8560 / NS-C) TaxID=523849 RepID=H3ZR44_THELN|nr:protein-glutamate O-methyltransferase CheR [Thermococcus litoralis]EHR77513.1 chemotaxis protein [Thermococcus litoralis DSM 5473]